MAVPADGDLIILDFCDCLHFLSSYLYRDEIPSADLLLQMTSSCTFGPKVLFPLSIGVEMTGTRDLTFGAPFVRGFAIHSSSLRGSGIDFVWNYIR